MWRAGADHPRLCQQGALCRRSFRHTRGTSAKPQSSIVMRAGGGASPDARRPQSVVRVEAAPCVAWLPALPGSGSGFGRTVGDVRPRRPLAGRCCAGGGSRSCGGGSPWARSATVVYRAGTAQGTSAFARQTSMSNAYRWPPGTRWTSGQVACGRAGLRLCARLEVQSAMREARVATRGEERDLRREA